MFSGFGLKPPASGFQSYSYSSLKTSPSVTSKAVPSVVLASSVCMQSLQCLISALTQGGGGRHFFRLTCSVVLWGGRDAANKYHWRVFAVSWPHWVWPCSWCVCFPSLYCSGSRLLCRELSEASLGCMHFPGLSHSGSGTQVVLRGADSVGLAFCALPRPSSPGDQVFGKHSHCDLLPPPALPLGFLSVQPVHLLRWMSTVQNPKKSWLAMKPTCSLVDDVSLGPRLPPSSSGCPRLPVSAGDGPVHSWLALVSPLFCE